MSRRPARCTEADLKRAMKIADQSVVPRVVEIAPDGTIRIVPAAARHEPEDQVEDAGEIVL